MFERFTERAREAVTLAQNDAREQGQPYIGTEHLTVGLFKEQEGLAARVLGNLGLTLEVFREKLAAIPEAELATMLKGEGLEVAPRRSPEPLTGQVAFTPGAKKTLELALREALGLGHNYIGTEHLLLGLMRVYDGVAVNVLSRTNIDAEKIRIEVIRMLSGRPSQTADVPARPAAARAARRRGEVLATIEADVAELRDEIAVTRAAMAALDPKGTNVKLSEVLPGFVWAMLVDPRVREAVARRIIEDTIDAVEESASARRGLNSDEGARISGEVREEIVAHVCQRNPDIEER